MIDWLIDWFLNWKINIFCCILYRDEIYGEKIKWKNEKRGSDNGDTGGDIIMSGSYKKNRDIGKEENKLDVIHIHIHRIQFNTIQFRC